MFKYKNTGYIGEYDVILLFYGEALMFFVALHESLIVIADITDPAKFLPFWEFKKYIKKI